MCLISFAIRPSDRVQWVVAANRDESYSRPTQALSEWRSAVGVRVVGGRDLKDGGVWMAEQPDTGRVAFLTNVRRGGPESGIKSRGELALAWLHGGDLAAWTADHDASHYAGCNLVLGDPDRGQWWWLTNRDAQQNELSQWLQKPLAAGLYGLSNASLDTPWPKTQRLKLALSTALEPLLNGLSGLAEFDTQMLTALNDRSVPPEASWPKTHISREAEAALAPVFVHWPAHDYGTRTATVIAKLAGAPSAHWIERSFDARGSLSATHLYPPDWMSRSAGGAGV